MNQFDRNLELYMACVHGDVVKVKQLIKLGVHLNRRDSSGRTLLHDASIRNDMGIIRTLVQNGANEYVKDSKGRTPLMYAAAKGHFEIVKYLIERNTFRIPVISSDGILMVETHDYLNTLDDDGRSCLMYACGEGHNEVVKYIIDSGADATIIDTGGRNALMYACREGYTDLVELLLNRGVNINSVSNVGWSALHYSCLRGHYKLVKLLLDSKIDVNIENNMSNTAAYFAFKSGNIDIVKLLFEYGLEISAKDIADILWLIKFWTAFVPGTQFAKYEQFIICLCELFKHKTIIDENYDLTLCLIETVYRTYIRQRFDKERDKYVRKTMKYLITLSIYVGNLKQINLFNSNWFYKYFNLNSINIDEQQLKIDFLNHDAYVYEDENCAYETYKDFRKLIINLTCKPLSLKALCRQKIRKNLNFFNRKTINSLQLPLKLHNYLAFDYL